MLIDVYKCSNEVQPSFLLSERTSGASPVIFKQGHRQVDSWSIGILSFGLFSAQLINLSTITGHWSDGQMFNMGMISWQLIDRITPLQTKYDFYIVWIGLNCSESVCLIWVGLYLSANCLQLWTTELHEESGLIMFFFYVCTILIHRYIEDSWRFLTQINAQNLEDA